MVSISPSRPSSELGGRRGYRRYRPESRDVSRARPCNTDPRRASARRVDRAARTRPRRAAPAHSRSGLGEFAPTCARGSARRTPAPLTPCLHAERAVQSPVDVRAESREARLEVRRQLRAAALEPRDGGKQQTEENSKTLVSARVGSLVSAEVGFRGAFVDISERRFCGSTSDKS